MPDHTAIESASEQTLTEQLRDLINELTTEQVRFAVARQHTTTDKAAAEDIGLSPRSVYDWPNKARVNHAVKLLALHRTAFALEMFDFHLLDAVFAKIDGLRDEDRRVRQAAATEIIDRAIGKPLQRQRHQGQSEVTLRILPPKGYPDIRPPLPDKYRRPEDDDLDHT